MSPCPCGSGTDYDACCGPLHAGTAQASTAVALMRARYSAYARGDVDYVRHTWHPRTRPPDLTLDPQVGWRRLHVVDTEGGAAGDAHGVVEFVARYRSAAGTGLLRERSEFVHEGGRWLYLRGTVAPD